MEEQEAIWERRDGEERWYARFLLFRDMGPGRSLLGAENIEKVRRGLKKAG